MLTRERRRKVIAPLHAAIGPHATWLAKSRWDVVVVDEVHHLMASTELYDFVRSLSRSVPALLLLSALPAQQRKDEFLRLLALLEPDRYSGTPPAEFDALYDAQARIGRLLRRLRKRLEAAPIDRAEARQLAANLMALPALAADATLRQRALTLESDGGSFDAAAWEFFRAVADRGRINRRILRNRRARLVEEGQVDKIERVLDLRPYEASQLELEAAGAVRGLLALAREGLPTEVWSALARVFVQSLAHPALAADLLGQLSAAVPVPPHAAEGLRLGHLAGTLDWPQYRDGLLASARRCLPASCVAAALAAVRRWAQAPGAYARLDALAALLEAQDGSSPPKLLVFAGFPKLAESLAGELRWLLGGEAVAEFRGEMSREEKEAAVHRFRTAAATRLLVCDETGGEGRNFQFAEALVHFDTPWYVSRVEQRVGRLDRLGRTAPVVTSHVLYNAGSPEGDLVRCYAEGFGVYTQSVSGLEFALRDLECDMVLSLLGRDAVPVEEILADLAQRAEQERTRDENEAALDEASFDSEAAERYRRGRNLEEAERAFETTFLDYYATVATNKSVRNLSDAEFTDGVRLLNSDEFQHIRVEVEAPRDGEGCSR